MGGLSQSGPVNRPGTEADDRHSKFTGQGNLGEGSEHPAYGNEDLQDRAMITFLASRRPVTIGMSM